MVQIPNLINVLSLILNVNIFTVTGKYDPKVEIAFRYERETRFTFIVVWKTTKHNPRHLIKGMWTPKWIFEVS